MIGKALYGMALFGMTLVEMAAIGAARGADGDEPPTPPGVQTQITIGHATTRVLAPLTARGYPNYIAAINERFGRGVNSENNAALPLLAALGPESTVSDDIRAEYRRLLGVGPPPPEGERFIRWEHFVGESLGEPGDPARAALEKQLDAARERPWKADELPQVAAWLKAQEKPLATIVAGLKRERFFVPLLPAEGGKPLMAVELPLARETRSVASALVARAMLRSGEDKLPEAMDDLLAVERLARHVGGGPTLIEALVGFAISGMARQAENSLARHPALTAKQAREFAAALRGLPPPARVADKLDVSERHMLLDGVCLLAEGDRKAISSLTGDSAPAASAGLFKAANRLLVDYNESLRVGNAWCDRLVAVARLPTHAERTAAGYKLETEIHALREQFDNPTNWLRGMLTGGRQHLGRAIGQMLVTMLSPATLGALTAETRTDQGRDLTLVAFALAEHRAERQSYPDALDQLAPKFLDKIPTDLFSGAALRYEKTEDGYKLYSVGPNLKDNGGVDWRTELRADDISM